MPAEVLGDHRDVLIRVRGHEINGIIDSYGHREIGDLVAVVDSEYYVEVAVVNGSAAKRLGAQVGDVVDVVYRD